MRNSLFDLAGDEVGILIFLENAVFIVLIRRVALHTL